MSFNSHLNSLVADLIVFQNLIPFICCEYPYSKLGQARVLGVLGPGGMQQAMLQAITQEAGPISYCPKVLKWRCVCWVFTCCEARCLRVFRGEGLRGGQAVLRIYFSSNGRDRGEVEVVVVFFMCS